MKSRRRNGKKVRCLVFLGQQSFMLIKASVMRELEEEDRMIQTRNQRRRAKEAAAREAAALAAAQMHDADPNNRQ